MPMYLNVLNNTLGMKKKKTPENLISVINNVQVNWVREDERLLLTVSQTISGSPFEFSFVNKKDKTGQSFNINVKQWLNGLRNYQMWKISTFPLSMKLLKAFTLSNKPRFIKKKTLKLFACVSANRMLNASHLATQNMSTTMHIHVFSSIFLLILPHPA